MSWSFLSVCLFCDWDFSQWHILCNDMIKVKTWRYWSSACFLKRCYAVLMFIDRREEKNKKGRGIHQFQRRLESCRYPCGFPCTGGLSAERSTAHYCRARHSDIWSRWASSGVSHPSFWWIMGCLQQRRGLHVHTWASWRTSLRSEKHCFAGLLPRFFGQHHCNGSKFYQ